MAINNKNEANVLTWYSWKIVSKAHIFNALIILYFFFLRLLDKATTTNHGVKYTNEYTNIKSKSSKFEEESKVPQTESAVQLPAAEVDLEVSERICGVKL